MTASTKRSRPYLLAVAGGSGSGKTYFARAIQKAMGEARCVIVPQDNFYFDQSARFDRDGGAVNFDHPDSIDFRLLGQCLGELKKGSAVDIPIYDFATHKRLAKTFHVLPREVIIVDGILILHSTETRPHFDEMIFFDTPEDLRFSRRLERDVSERGRTAEGVREQFLRQVKPMHDQFVEPSKGFATTIVKDPANLDKALARFLSLFSECPTRGNP